MRQNGVVLSKLLEFAGDFLMTTQTDEQVTDDTTQAAVATEAPKVEAASKKAAPKKAAPKAAVKATEGILTLAQATTRALKENAAMDVGRIFVLPINLISKYDNPRHEPEHLHELGYTLFGDGKVEESTEDGKQVSLVHLALSEEMEHVRQYVELIEEHEGPVMRLLNPQGKPIFTGSLSECKAKLKDQADKSGWKIDEHPSAPQSIVRLAEDIFLYTQLAPIEVRQHGKTITGIDGGRRIAAILYLHAKSKVCRADQVACELFGEGVPNEYPALVQATELKATGDDFLLAVMINLSRKQFTPLQEGRVYHEMLKKINPETNKTYTMKEAAASLGVEYGTYRNREALWRDPDGNGKGLTDNDRRKVALGEITLTAASRKALGEQHYSPTGTPQRTRAKALPLAEIHKLFDATPVKNEVRRQAFAECMGITLKQAAAESDKRIEELDAKELAKSDRKNSKGKKAKAA